MKVIGLCGGSGSGKGAVSSIFAEIGIPSIDTDAVYREMTLSDSPCMRELRGEFGDEVVNSQGGLDRARLASIVFSDPSRLKILNKIAHSFILDETRRRLAKYSDEGFPAAIVDAPVLFESGFDKECDEIICVLADRDVRTTRIMSRDGITRDAAEKRIASQMPDETLISKCDHVIYNNSDIESLREQILSLKNKLI
ncbi:MAG: dephospho-CoA kinase [Clostridia bacterium]|nr:dephospho-CoA kinase [Clostridia bacterium]